MEDVVRKNVSLGIDVSGFMTGLEGIGPENRRGRDIHAGAGRGLVIRSIHPDAIERSGTGDRAVSGVDNACARCGGSDDDSLRAVEESTINGEPGISHKSPDRGGIIRGIRSRAQKEPGFQRGRFAVESEGDVFGLCAVGAELVHDGTSTVAGGSAERKETAAFFEREAGVKLAAGGAAILG